MNEKELEKMRKIIKMTLIRIGVRCDFIGFSYLCYAIELVILQPELIHNLCKGLYVKVGEKFGTEAENNVERSIRHAIENVFICRNFSELNKMFNTILYKINDKPTAGEFIKLIAEYYNLGLYKNDFLFEE